jgi:L-lactate dehydrogenase complex protein LldE
MPKPHEATLFIPCLVDAVYPEVAEAVVTLFRHLGLSVRYPTDQTCCGQPAYNSGYLKEARTAARHFIEVFENAGDIVCPSGSCVDMVRHHYPQLLAEDGHWQHRARNIASRTYELTEFLVDVLDLADIGACFEGRVTYHDSCHLLRGLRVQKQPRQLLAGIEGLEFIEMKDSDYCCGFGGTFAVKYPDISTAMVDDKVQHIIDTGAEVVTGGDMGCLMNIEGRLHRLGASVKALHIAQLLVKGIKP